jgi:predicted nucleic acid-binding protein
MIVVDTSVAVAAALSWHEAHDVVRSALPRARTRLLAQVAVEAYSVLTRLPPPQRVTPALAYAYLEQNYRFPPIALSAHGYERLIEVVAAEHIAGGAVYDAIVAATAKEAGATLLTLDRRAIDTYRKLNAAYRVAG